MIRTLVVDDDFMAASMHRQFTERVPGFEVVGEATSGRQALTLVAELRPDLMLLDMYLPDLSGIEVLRRVRAAAGAGSGAAAGAALDVIAITSAKDMDILRQAMHLGVVHYIVKPFTLKTFQERMRSYAAARARLQQMRQPEQRDIDRLYALLRTSGEESLPKGISAPTLAMIAEELRDAGAGVSAVELATRTGISQGVIRRYLRYLAGSGLVDFSLRYGAAGRPEHLYHWTGSAHPSGSPRP